MICHDAAQNRGDGLCTRLHAKHQTNGGTAHVFGRGFKHPRLHDGACGVQKETEHGNEKDKPCRAPSEGHEQQDHAAHAKGRHQNGFASHGVRKVAGNGCGNEARQLKQGHASTHPKHVVVHFFGQVQGQKGEQSALCHGSKTRAQCEQKQPRRVHQRFEARQIAAHVLSLCVRGSHCALCDGLVG